MKPLTQRQKQILEMISRHIDDTGFPPTRAEICTALGFKSPNAAEEHLKALEKKGAITMVPGASRSIKVSDKSYIQSNQLTLPLIGRVSAGFPILSEEHIETQYDIDPNLFSSKPDYLLRVKGMSMRDAGILEDDLLIVKKLTIDKFTKLNGKIVVARIDDEVTVKKYQKKKNQIYLLPENPSFNPIVIDTHKQSFCIEGLAIGVLRNPKFGL